MGGITRQNKSKNKILKYKQNTNENLILILYLDGDRLFGFFCLYRSHALSQILHSKRIHFNP
jgi:hypothetical protein